MKSEVAKLGSSLLEPCVQELAKKPLAEVPPRYVRTDEDPAILSDTNSLPQVPLTDMKKLFSEELEQLQHACKEWGFFQLINHGVSTALVEKVKSEIQEFFSLPMKEKKFWQKPDEIEGFGQALCLRSRGLTWETSFT